MTNAPWKDSFHSHFAPTVSPDGTRIAFTDADQCSGGTTSYALRVIDRSGHTTNDLGLLPGNAYYPVNPEYAGDRPGRPTEVGWRSSPTTYSMLPIATGVAADASPPQTPRASFSK